MRASEYGCNDGKGNLGMVLAGVLSLGILVQEAVRPGGCGCFTG
jgi:hypothetical protein